MRYIILGPYYHSLVLSILLTTRSRSFGIPIQFDVWNSKDDFLDPVLQGCILAHHPVLAGIVSQKNNHITEVVCSSNCVQEPLQLHTTFPIMINRNGLGETSITQEFIQLYRNIQTSVSKILVSAVQHMQFMSIPTEPFAIDLLFNAHIPVEWRLAFLQSCGRFFLGAGNRRLALQDIFDFQSSDFLRIAKHISVNEIFEQGMQSYIPKLFTQTYQNGLQHFFSEMINVGSRELIAAIYQLIVDILKSPTCPHLEPLPQKDVILSKYLFECISNNPKKLQNISNIKTGLEMQFSMLGGNLVQQESLRSVFQDISVERSTTKSTIPHIFLEKKRHMIWLPFVSPELSTNWSSFLEEMTDVHTMAEQIWQNIMNPSY